MSKPNHHPTHPDQIRERNQHAAELWAQRADLYELEAGGKLRARDPKIQQRGIDCANYAVLAREEARLCLVIATDNTDYTPESDRRGALMEAFLETLVPGPPARPSAAQVTQLATTTRSPRGTVFHIPNGPLERRRIA